MDDDRWTVRELKPNELAGVGSLIERGKLADTFLVRAALEKGEAFKGWWYGGLRNGTDLEAVMAVENHKACVYAHSEAAARGMGYELYQQQKRMGSAMQATHRHQVFGELKTVSNIWHYLKDLPDRKAISDRTCGLLEVDLSGRPEKPPSSRVELSVATEADLRLVFDLTAEAITEQIQLDPRKAGRDAHWARCEAIISRGLQVIAREEGRPFFVAELAKQTRDIILLDRVHVPTQFRSRPRLLAGAFWHAAGFAERIGGRRLFALTTDGALTEASQQAGWRLASTWRWAIALG
jgi:hypothetical protein